jgi:Mrp family chromosome partitioning ATPase
VTTISVGEPTVVGAAWRYRLLVLAAVVGCVGAVGVYAETRPAVYSALGTMVLRDPHSAAVFANSTGQAPDRYTGDQIAVLKSPQLAAAAAAVGAAEQPPLGLTADDFTKDSVVAGTPLSGNLVQVTFTASKQATALAGVDAIKTAYEKTVHDAVSADLATLLAQIDTELSSIDGQLTHTAAQLVTHPAAADQQSLTQQQTALTARRDTLTAKRDQVAVDAASGSNGVDLYLPPQTTTHNSKLVAALPLLAVAAVLGLLVGVLSAFVLASRRRLFRGRDEPEAVLGAPLLAEIPQFGPAHPLPAADGEPAPAATGFRRGALFIQGSQSPETGLESPQLRAPAGARRLVIVSASRREGRSTVAANLGIALADNGLSTLLIDADPITGGLTQLLYDRYELAPVLDRVGLAPAGLSLADVFLPGNSDVRLALMRAEHARLALDDPDRDERLQVLESTFSVVIIDAPPLSDAGPYWPLVRRADSAIVLLTDQTPVAQVEEVSRLLSAIEMPASGYIYNHRPRLRRAPPTPARRASDPPASFPGSRPAGVGLVPRRAGGTRAPAEHAHHKAGIVAQVASRQPPGLRSQAEEPFES